MGTVKYEVTVITGDIKKAGTDANVHITIFGTHGDTGKRPLTQKFRDLFERNQKDVFVLEAIDLGKFMTISSHTACLLHARSDVTVYLLNVVLAVTGLITCTGELSKIVIEHDNKGFGADWYLERVEILNQGTNRKWEFPCGQWLAKGKGDGQLSRELYARE